MFTDNEEIIYSQGYIDGYMVHRRGEKQPRLQEASEEAPTTRYLDIVRIKQLSEQTGNIFSLVEYKAKKQRKEQ